MDLEVEVAMVVAVHCLDEEMPEERCCRRTCKSEVGRRPDLVIRCLDLPEEIGTTMAAVICMGDTAGRSPHGSEEDGRCLVFERIRSDDWRSSDMGLASSHLGKMEHCMRCSGSAL
ncbi:hypothetical protein ACLOJK_029409 [Asimina triloba]